MQNLRLATWLTEDEYERFESMEGQQQVRKELRDKYDDFYPVYGNFSTDVFEGEITLGALNLKIQCGVLPSLPGMSLAIGDGRGILGLSALNQQSFFYAPRRKELILNAQ